ncbi:MAG: polyketide synthase of type I, partial [Moraxellaceae bacterium]
RYPEAVNLQEYWINLRDGKDCITEIPQSRWNWQEYFTEDRNQEGHYSKWGGFISGVDEFDPRFFNIAPREAASIDPQERLFLQHAWMAVEDAGYTRTSLQIQREQGLAGQVGVYVGVMYGEYNLSGSLATIANRVSYVLNLHGPSMTLDTMCSSSLTAIHLACQDLKSGRTDLGIAGGVNISVHPGKYSMLSEGQFISSDGHCQSFGEGGDGYIPGEGVGAVILKRLSDAEQDGNHIYGVIKGSAINHGGKTNGYTVPNPQAQTGVIAQAFVDSNVNPYHVSYIEAHGTGTKLGDPIEIAALGKAFQQHYKSSSAPHNEFGFCAIGSAKSNIGHCESAAGIAGLTKVLLQMRHQKIVPSLHSARLNPHIDFEHSPFVVNQSLRAWDRPVINGETVPRIAGISSFGAGGSNAHIIVEEYQAASNETHNFSAHDEQVMVPISARTAEQLKQKARDLLEFVTDKQFINLNELAYTLQVGREAMDDRVGFLVSSIEQLAEKLHAYVNEIENVEDTYEGQVKSNKDTLALFSTDSDLQQTIDKWIADKKLSKLLDLWAKGLDLNWDKLYDNSKPKRISLPAYPFAKEKYWNDPVVAGAFGFASKNSAKTTSVLHSLLHKNTSDLFQQSYSSTFNGNEFFLKDFHGSATKVLPAVAYLEMAHAAVLRAMPNSQESGIVELHDVVWAEPVEVGDDKEISIALLMKDQGRIGYEVYSRDEADEIIHCQGIAVFSSNPAPSRLDITQLKTQMGGAQLDVKSLYNTLSSIGVHYDYAHQCITSFYQGESQLLADLKLPDGLANQNNDYILHPSLMDSALQAAMVLIPGNPELSFPVAMENVRVVFGCTGEMMAWVRYSSGGHSQGAYFQDSEEQITKLDIDLCDLQGNICVQMRGIHYQQALHVAASTPTALNAIPSAADESLVVTKISEEKNIPTPVVIEIPIVFPHALQKISIREPDTKILNVTSQNKPSGMTLSAPDALTLENIPNASKGRPTKANIALSNPVATSTFSRVQENVDVNTGVKLYDYANGIFSIHIDASENKNLLTTQVIATLIRALDTVRQTAAVKVLVISGTEQAFLTGGRTALNTANEQKLYQAIAAFPYPVIASMRGLARGAGFLLGSACDFMICSEENYYSFTDPSEGLFPTAQEELLLRERFGVVQANDFLHLSVASTGKALLEKGWTCSIVPQHEVDSFAQKLAVTLSGKSRNALRLLKQHLARRIVNLVDGLVVVKSIQSDNENKISKAQAKISSSTKSIKLSNHGDHTLVVRLSSVEKNYSTKVLVKDLTDIFAQVKKLSQYKCIV